MDLKTRAAVLLLFGLLVAWGCAPVAEPFEDENAPPEPPPSAPEPLPAAPGRRADVLRNRIEAALTNVRERTLLRTNAFWTVFHAILGLGLDVEIEDWRTGEKEKALDYICAGKELRGLVFQPTLHGVDVVTLRDSQGQGHQDQFIAEMAQWSMPADKAFKVQGNDYKFLDFVKHSQMRASVKDNQELSWAVIVVSQYLDPKGPWTNARKETLRLEDMIQYEARESVEKAPCGGTHRLFGLTWCYHLHLMRGGKTEGVWKEVVERTREYAQRARQFQGPDGFFSTASFEKRDFSPDRQLRLNTTGHIFEWLALALPDDELKAGWMQEAASALSRLILEMEGSPMDSGSMYHAAHGLYIYHARVYGGDFAPKSLKIPLPPDWPSARR